MTNNEILKQIIGQSNKTHFALKHGINRAVLAKWLNDSRNIKFTTLQKIATKENYKLTLKIEKL